MKKLISGIDGGGNGIKFIKQPVKKKQKLSHLSGKTMGTTYHVKYLDEGSMKATC